MPVKRERETGQIPPEIEVNAECVVLQENARPQRLNWLLPSPTIPRQGAP